MRCEDVQGKLELFVYGELPGEEIAAIEAHVGPVGGCEQCAAMLREVRAAQGALNAWENISAPTPVSVALEAIEGEAVQPVIATIVPQRSGRGRRIVPWLMGAAAGVALALTVLAVGAQVRSTDGQLVISFGRGAAGEKSTNVPAQPASAELSADQLDQLSGQIEWKVDQRAVDTLELVRQQFRELKGEQEQRFLALVHTIRAMREEDIDRYEQQLKAVAAETQQTKAALNDVARTVALLPAEQSFVNGPATPGRKEIVP
jgi:hypothetical protein